MNVKEEKLVNPVQVKIGCQIKDNETPLFLWQIEKDPEMLSRPKSPNLKLNFTGKQSDLLNELYQYTIVPGDKLRKKLDFYYTPYNTKFLLRKHMTFGSEEKLQPLEEEVPS